MRQKLYFGGVPTDMDIAKLDELFGVPEIGTTIDYKQVEAAIQEPWNSNRFKTVTTRWRKQLERDHSIFLKAIPGAGYLALDAKGRVTVASSKLGSGKRMIGRAVSIAAKTDTRQLEPEDKMVCDHVRNMGQMIRQSIATAPRKIEYPDAKIVSIR